MISIFSSILRSHRLIQAPVTQIARRLHQRAIPVTWPRPALGYIKLNFDGSSKGKSGDASIGGLVRNYKGEFLLGYAEPISKTTGLMAEFIALKRGLELVLEHSWCNVWLEGDAETLVEILGDGKQVKSEELQRIVGDINMMIPELNECMLSHIYREGNRAADRLANMGHELDKLHIWRHFPPSEILQFIREDAEGKIVLRRR